MEKARIGYTNYPCAVKGCCAMRRVGAAKIEPAITGSDLQFTIEPPPVTRGPPAHLLLLRGNAEVRETTFVRFAQWSGTYISFGTGVR